MHAGGLRDPHIPRDSEPESLSQALRLGYKAYAESWGPHISAGACFPCSVLVTPPQLSQTSPHPGEGEEGHSAGLPRVFLAQLGQHFHGCRQVWREVAQGPFIGSLGRVIMKMGSSIGAKVLSPPVL